ncbi:hypothetical protein [Gemmatimonas sp.]
MFDVLGFKDMLERTSLADIASAYRSLIDAKLMAARVPVGARSGVSVEVSGTTIFSDTILVWSDDTWDAVQSFLVSCSVLIGTALGRGWPLRGGIAYGDVILNRAERIFVGQPIVDAHLTECSQDWVGAALHPSVLSHVTFGANIASLQDVIAYPVPVKAGASPLSHALHWCPYSTDSRTHLATLRSAARNPGAQAKYDATLAYLDRHCRNYQSNS